MLLENVWDYHFDPQTNVIDVHVSRLRAKIDKGFERPLLHTVRGAGYMIRASGHGKAVRTTAIQALRDGLQAVAGLSRYFHAFAFCTWLRRLERAARAERSVRRDDRGGDQRSVRAVSFRRPAPPRQHRRAAARAARRLPLPRHRRMRASGSRAISAPCRRAFSTSPGRFETAYGSTDEARRRRIARIVRVFACPAASA